MSRPSGRHEAPPPARIGPYEVVREVARGGMGIVYAGRRPGLDRLVAIKVLLGEGGDLARFRLEAQAIARLRHPNVVALHDVGQDRGRPFLVLDLIDGRSLQDRLDAEGPLPPREAARLAAAVGRALHHAHTQSILHRDVKPANVLLDRDGAPLLTDFGLAKVVSGEDGGLTATGDVMGTPAYMPPEQASGEVERIDRRADVYALGATLYALLTGEAPFAGPTALNVLRQVLEEPAPAPSARQVDVPSDLDVICRKCLEKDPTHRYRSAQEVAEDLERFLDGVPILARPASIARRARAWVRRRPFAAGLVSAGVAIAVLVALAGPIREALQAARARGAVAAELDRVRGLPLAERGPAARPEAVADRVAQDLGLAPGDRAAADALAAAIAKARPELWRILSEAALARGDLGLAYGYDPTGPAGVDAILALADQLVDEGRLDVAARLLPALPPGAPEAQRLGVRSVRGRIALARGDYTGAHRDLAADHPALPVVGGVSSVAWVELPLQASRGGRHPLVVLDSPDGPTLHVVDRPEAPAFRYVRRPPAAGELVPAAPSPLGALWARGSVDQAHVVDLHADGAPEVVAVLRPDAGAAEVCVVDPSRPERPLLTAPLPDRPSGAAILDLDGRPGEELVLTVEHPSDAVFMVRGAGGGVRLDRLRLPGESRRWPVAASSLDVDGDGSPELVLGWSAHSGGEAVAYRLDQGALRRTGRPSPPLGLPSAARPLGERVAVLGVRSTYLARDARPRLALDDDAVAVLGPDGAGGLALEAAWALPPAEKGSEPTKLYDLEVGRLGGRDRALVARLREEAPAYGRWQLLVGTPGEDPVVLGTPGGEAVLRLRLVDVGGGDREPELVLLGEGRLVVCDQGVRPAPEPDAAAAPSPADPIVADEAALLLDTARRLLEGRTAATVAKAKAVASVVADRFEDAPQALEARLLGVEAQLRAGLLAEEAAEDAADRGDVAALRSDLDRALADYAGARGAARALDEALVGRPVLRRRGRELAVQAAAWGRDWSALAALPDPAAAAPAAADDSPVARPGRELAALAEETVLDLSDPSLPLVADRPLRVERTPAGVTTTVDGRGASHVLGVPVRYFGGGLRVAVDFELASSAWVTYVGFGLVPSAPAAFEGDWMAGYATLYLCDTRPWREQSPALPTGRRLRPGLGYAGRWRVVAGYYPEAGLVEWRVLRRDPDGELVLHHLERRSVNEKARRLVAGRRVLGVLVRQYPTEDAWSHNSAHPVQTRLRLERVAVRSVRGLVPRAPTATDDGLARTAAARLLAGDREAAHAAWARRLELAPWDGHARLALALLRPPAEGARLLGGGLARFPYETVVALDEGLRGAPPERLRAVGERLVRIAPDVRPELVAAFTGDRARVGAAGGADPASRYARLRVGRAWPDDRATLLTAGRRPPGLELATVVWAPDGPAQAAAAALEARLGRQLGAGDDAEPYGAWLTLSRLLLLAPRDVRRLELRRQIALGLGRSGPAERDALRAAEVAPDSAVGPLGLAEVFALRAAPAHAARHVAEALRRGADPAEVRRLVAGPRFHAVRDDPAFREHPEVRPVLR